MTLWTFQAVVFLYSPMVCRRQLGSYRQPYRKDVSSGVYLASSLLQFSSCAEVIWNTTLAMSLTLSVMHSKKHCIRPLEHGSPGLASLGLDPQMP